MAETPIVTAMLVSVVAVHLFGVGTPVFAGKFYTYFCLPT